MYMNTHTDTQRTCRHVGERSVGDTGNIYDPDPLPGRDGLGWLEWHIVACCAPHSVSKGVVNTEPNILHMVVSEVQDTNLFLNVLKTRPLIYPKHNF